MDRVGRIFHLGKLPVNTQIGAYRYNAKQYDPISPQWFLRFWLTPVVPAPAWASKPLFGGSSRFVAELSRSLICIR